MAKFKRPITAIITRTKNRNVLLERAIKSVLAQTSKDYIHVILNDGGDKKAVESLLKKYPDTNRKVIHNQESAGLTKALNQAIRAVESDYVAILDDDDTWHTDRVEKVNEYLYKNTKEPVVVVCMDRVIEELNDDGTITEVSRNRWHGGVTEVSLYDQALDNYLSNGAVTYRRSLYEELNGYDESLDVAEDWDFGIRCMLKYDVLFLPEVLSYYHHRPSAKGDSGNSVFAGVDTHHRNLVKLRNRYLRSDISNGSFGIGFIMNHLHGLRRIVQEGDTRSDERIVRLEGHINYTIENLRSDLSKSIDSASLYRTIKNKLDH